MRNSSRFGTPFSPSSTVPATPRSRRTPGSTMPTPWSCPSSSNLSRSPPLRLPRHWQTRPFAAMLSRKAVSSEVGPKGESYAWSGEMVDGLGAGSGYRLGGLVAGRGSDVLRRLGQRLSAHGGEYEPDPDGRDP